MCLFVFHFGQLSIALFDVYKGLLSEGEGGEKEEWVEEGEEGEKWEREGWKGVGEGRDSGGRAIRKGGKEWGSEGKGIGGSDGGG